MLGGEWGLSQSTTEELLLWLRVQHWAEPPVATGNQELSMQVRKFLHCTGIGGIRYLGFSAARKLHSQWDYGPQHFLSMIHAPGMQSI